ncbi:MAG: tRNA (adenosine(37)-N6)-threonylcarbamoyltransferase complex transferase subunit TsaD [Patescibacteria group bacterium]|nr:tRNA (adenosine(37)-N6)-threonylcarbamoyltransferase complex transferase subunit TsaD [Patescibacteria group bacterium]
MKILAFETSCDETSAAVLQGDTAHPVSVLSNIVSSQIAIHAKWGGVVPSLAAREHLKNCIPVINSALEHGKTNLDSVDLFTVTQGPGLIPALLIGTNVAKTLSYFHKKPLIGIHHIEGHIYANLLKTNDDPKKLFPLISLIVSGGHTQLIRMKGHFQYEIIGQTHDDAVGEAFDKVSKMLDLGYPGGPIVSKRAQDFEKNISAIKNKKLKDALLSISFPRPMISSNDLNFSFSGLKTAVLYFMKDMKKKKTGTETMELYKGAICYAFQEAAIEVLVSKTMDAVRQFAPLTLLVAGGVAANKKLIEKLKESINELDSVRFISPKLEYCGDNAAMIGVAAFYRYNALEKANRLKELGNNWKTLEADANMKLQKI